MVRMGSAQPMTPNHSIPCSAERDMSKHERPEAMAALDAWADQIVKLESDVAAGVAAYSKRLASDRRLSAEDRQFATAQADAIRRAIRRKKAKGDAPASGKAARKQGKKD